MEGKTETDEQRRADRVTGQTQTNKHKETNRQIWSDRNRQKDRLISLTIEAHVVCTQAAVHGQARSVQNDKW